MEFVGLSCPEGGREREEVWMMWERVLALLLCHPEPAK